MVGLVKRPGLILLWAASTGACGFREIPLEPACFVYVVASDTHTCARKTDGTLWCWGDNRYGQLGLGDVEPRALPAMVEELGSEVAGIYLPVGSGVISTRTAFTCARKTDGTLWCWGNNENGQLGLGDTSNRLSPTRVTSLGDDVHAAALGSAFGCARKTDSSILCWGANESGQLGLGDTTERSTPVEVDLGPGPAARYLTTGVAHTCARMTDGTLRCWGNNAFGQLGTGDNEPHSLPVAIDTGGPPSGVDVVVAGGQHTCVTHTDSTLACFGDNRYGQLGTGDDAPRSSATPVPFPQLAGGIPLITAGGSHTCVGRTDGTVWCFGANASGQLGNGGTDNSSTPTEVTGELLAAGVAVVYAGGQHTCARTIDSALVCWGSNEYGQLGVGGGPGSPVPVAISSGCP